MAQTIHYRPLAHGECARIREIDASQYIGKAWRSVDGVLRLVEINYLDPDFPEGYENHLCRLRQTISEQGIAIGAFEEDGSLAGFAALNLAPFGKSYRHVLLDQLFISKKLRRKGIGKHLFFLAASEARKHHMQKIYICAGSSEETLAFYRALGCVDAAEIDADLLANDPRDIQLEYALL